MTKTTGLKRFLPKRFQKKNGLIFVPKKKLCQRDMIIVDMLNRDVISFCITDPQQEDNPVIYISEGFHKLTGYENEDVIGRNCRFLQGPDTTDEEKNPIREAIKLEQDCNVSLTNYKKDGTKFKNEFFLTTLRSPKEKLEYFVGIQVPKGQPAGVLDDVLTKEIVDKNKD